MRILLTFDDNYAPHAAVTVESILRNTSIKPDFAIMYFEEKLTQATREILLLHFENRVNSIKFYPVGDQIKNYLSQVDIPDYLSHDTFLRLFSANILKDDDVILYLDVDIIVYGDIECLMNSADLNYVINAVAEHYPSPRIKELESKAFKTEKERISLNQEVVLMNRKKLIDMLPDTPYFNGGVMIINLKKWREEQILDRCLQFFSTHKVLPCADQDVLNGIFNGNFGKLPLCWNIHPYIKTLNEYTCRYTKEELKEAVEYPKIIHFTDYKAWNYLYENKFEKELYWKYRAATPWPQRKEQGKNLKNIFFVNLYRPMRKLIKSLLGEKILRKINQIK